jgi:valyl-tRNA synthetase
LKTHAHYIEGLAALSSLKVRGDGERPKTAASAVIRELEIYVPLEGVLDFAEESRRLEKEMSKLEPELARSQKKLANNAFLNRAPADVVDKEKDKLERLTGKLNKIRTQIERLREISAGE